MEDILKYENRDSLYQFLIDEFGLEKLHEQYDPDLFGNFFIILAAKDFLLKYINDRSFLTITIASKLKPDKGFDLSFVKSLLYDPLNMNEEEIGMDNVSRIESLNNFLKKDFQRICQLFEPKNYDNTKKQIDEYLKLQFKKRNPGLI